MTISKRRSCFGILPGAMLPASLPTLDLGKDDRLATDCEYGIDISSSKGSGAMVGKAVGGRDRKCRTIRECDSERWRNKLCHCEGYVL